MGSGGGEGEGIWRDEEGGAVGEESRGWGRGWGEGVWSVELGVSLEMEGG